MAKRTRTYKLERCILNSVTHKYENLSALVFTDKEQALDWFETWSNIPGCQARLVMGWN